MSIGLAGQRAVAFGSGATDDDIDLLLYGSLRVGRGIPRSSALRGWSLVLDIATEVPLLNESVGSRSVRVEPRGWLADPLTTVLRVPNLSMGEKCDPLRLGQGIGCTKNVVGLYFVVEESARLGSARVRKLVHVDLEKVREVERSPACLPGHVCWDVPAREGV
ncbi:hypothetical protein BHM03_00015682 [Ensete ventricosum]|nr:hypothetical protein BHM03_00015682 [Ensete ventricosum]